MRKAFKYRLWTNANQERELEIMLETHRRLYNACLDQRKIAYEIEKRTIRYFEQSSWFKKQREINAFYARLNFSSAQATMRRLERSFASFFRRIEEKSVAPGYPKFKSREQFDSFEFPSHGDGNRLNGNRIRVQHVGVIRVNLHRPIEGNIKTITIKREAGKWYLIASCELPNVSITESGKPHVGIDVGLSHFLTTSDGEKEPNPRYYKEELPRLRRACRAVSRKKKGGKNRRKAVFRLQKIHSRVRNRRREHHHQVACKLVSRYGFIAAESLNIHGMLRNGRLSRSISDAGWYGFLIVLKSKTEIAGVRFVQVDPRGTSQSCSRCGIEVRKELSERMHNCHGCGLSMDRDHNASLNILARGLARTEPAEVNVAQKGRRFPRSRRYQAME